MEKSKLFQQFQNPETCFRSFPFWSWNDSMKPEEVREQIHGMKAAGMGGFFMHSRNGLETPYLEEEWMECVKAAVETAAELGMYAWLYDEDRWPSGTAGGKVSALGEAYCCKGLTLEICEPGEYGALIQEQDLIALYAGTFQGMEISGFRRLPTKTPGDALEPVEDALKLVGDSMASVEDSMGSLQGSMESTRNAGESGEELYPGERLLAVRLEVSGPSGWFNGQAPPDQLSPACVQKFLELTHEKYKEAVGKEFGKTVPGIFTDEPSLADTHASFAPNRGWIPWTYGFGAYFRERRGYDFLDVLPYQYFEGDFSRKTRHDYWRTITERFSENYSGTIHNWCKANGIAFTGHFLQEDKLGLCTRVNGAIMPHYALQDIPGIDILTERTKEYLTVKQCTSVAHQFGKKRVLTETYGCTGWDFTLEGQKWVGDWQYVLGVNLRTTHTAQYSLRGCRKRDYPPSFNYNNTCWEKNQKVEDYFARLGAVLSQGEPVRKFLLLHPASTAWSRVGTNPYGNPIRRNERDVPAVNDYGFCLNELLESLCREHMDCDLGDEILMQRHGFVKNGKLGIEKAMYDVVVVPPMDTLFASTCRLLLECLDQGGHVVFLKPVPFLVEGDGKKTEDLDRVLEHPGCCIIEEEELTGILDRLGVREIRFLDEKGREQRELLSMTRRLEEGTLLFTVNNNREKACEARVCLPFEGEVEEWDPLTGEGWKVICQGNGTETDGLAAKQSFTARWERAGSHLYRIRPGRSTGDGEERPDTKGKEPDSVSFAEESRQTGTWKLCPLPESADILLNGPNVLTLDFCQYRMGEGEWSAPLEIWKAQKEIRKALEMTDTEVQRYLWTREACKNDGTPVELKFTFWAGRTFTGCALALEQPWRFQILCNGKEVPVEGSGWFLDKAFETVSLPALRQGENQLVLSCDYCNDAELENCYLLGEFGVRENRVLCEQPRRLQIGDWTGQGFFHYCGSISYCYPYHWDGGCRVALRLGEYAGICATVTVGNQTYEIPWRRSEDLDVTEALTKGDNSIWIEIMGSPRNMLGPLHYKELHPQNTNAACFQPGEKDYTTQYQVVPYGLLERPVIVEERG